MFTIWRNKFRERKDEDVSTVLDFSRSSHLFVGMKWSDQNP